MTTTITQISNIFNLLAQNPISGLRFYHFGWRFDINRNIDNNFDPDNETGRLHPSLQFDVPEYAKYLSAIDDQATQEEIQITLYFDDLQDIENDGSQKIENLIEQWANLKLIAERFIYNFRILWEDLYQAGSIQGEVKFVQRSNMHNDKLITWEVTFVLLHQIPCIDAGDVIDTADFPQTIDETDLERTYGTPKTPCERILEQLTTELKLECVLPTYDFADADTQDALSEQQESDLTAYLLPLATCQELTDNLTTDQLINCILGLYDFSDVDTQNALTAQQILDLKTWLLPQYDFSDIFWTNLLTLQQESDLTNYLLPLVDFSDPAIQALITLQQQSDLINWLLPLVDFSNPAIQALLTPTQITDLKPVVVPALDFTIGFDDDFNLLSPTQITDLSTRICGVGTQYSLALDGVNEYLEASQVANQELERNNTFSCSCWVKLNQINKFHALVSKYIAPKGWYMAVDQNDGFAVSLQNNGAANGILVRTNTFSVPQNTWTHLAFTYSGNSLASGINLYINGALAAKTTTYDTLSATILQPTAKVLYGGIPTAAVYTNSKMFECVLWNVELSGAEVLADYNRAQSDNPPQLANIILHNRLGTGSTFGVNVFTMEDVSGNCNGIQSANMEFADRTTDVPI